MRVGGHAQRPVRRIAIALLIVAALVAGSLMLIRAADRGPAATIDTVATVRADLDRSPGAWLDRPLRVYAVPARRCVSWVAPQTPPCLRWYAELSDADRRSEARPLPLVLGDAPRMLAALRRLPLIRGWLPAPQAPRWGRAGVYQVQLHALPCSKPGWDDCYEAVLEDAAP